MITRAREYKNLTEGGYSRLDIRNHNPEGPSPYEGVRFYYLASLSISNHKVFSCVVEFTASKIVQSKPRQRDHIGCYGRGVIRLSQGIPSNATIGSC